MKIFKTPIPVEVEVIIGLILVFIAYVIVMSNKPVTIEVDNHQYLRVYYWGHVAITHKEDCTNSAHKVSNK